MRLMCAHCQQRVSLSWQYAKQPWWCTGGSTQTGRRKLLCLSCCKMSAKWTQCRVRGSRSYRHVEEHTRHASSILRIVITVLSGVLQAARSAAACCHTTVPFVNSLCAVVSVNSIRLHAGTQGLFIRDWLTDLSLPTGGTASKIPVPTSGQTQRVLESMVSPDCRCPRS